MTLVRLPVWPGREAPWKDLEPTGVAAPLVQEPGLCSPLHPSLEWSLSSHRGQSVTFFNKWMGQ